MMNDEKPEAENEGNIGQSESTAGLCRKQMDAETIKAGADLAEQVLQFAVFGYGKVTSDEGNRALAELFGPEVVAELDRRFWGHNLK